MAMMELVYNNIGIVTNMGMIELGNNNMAMVTYVCGGNMGMIEPCLANIELLISEWEHM